MKKLGNVLRLTIMSFIVLAVFTIIGCRHQPQQPTMPLQELPYPVKLEYDWVVFEKNFPTAGLKHTLATCHQDDLVTVNADFALRLKETGAGRLQDGRRIGTSKMCECGIGYNCFTFLDQAHPWGYTYKRTTRHLYTSVAASSLPLGSILYIPALDGATIPNTLDQKHNGYVRVDSRNYFGHNQINLFVGTEKTAQKFKYLFKEAVVVNICMEPGCDSRVLEYGNTARPVVQPMPVIEGADRGQGIDK